MSYLNKDVNAIPVYIIDGLTGQPVSFAGLTSPAPALDTQGNPVPTNLAHTYTYDDNGNLTTDRVTDGTNTWVRTYDTGPTGRNSDSGWVKQ